jgi:hypothetical protein
MSDGGSLRTGLTPGVRFPRLVRTADDAYDDALYNNAEVDRAPVA